MKSDGNRIVLMAVGDIMLGEHPITMGHGVGSVIKEHDSEYIFQNVASAFEGADIVFGNLESVLSTKNLNPRSLKSLQLRGHPNSVMGLVSAHFNVLSLSNNHTLEHGEEAILETTKVLSDNRIHYVGFSTDAAKVREPLFLTVRGIKVAFLAYCLLDEPTAFSSVTDVDEIIADVKKTRDQSDVVIVSLHWGNEFIEIPSPKQIEVGRRIIDAGANILLGHHPHVLQGIERYGGGIIAYSLGAFVWDELIREPMISPELQNKLSEGVILKLVVAEEGHIQTELIPLWKNENYQPTVLHGKSAEDILSKLSSLSLDLENEGLSNVDEKVRNYNKKVLEYREEYRKSIKKYYLKNIHRYPIRYTFQMCKHFIGKRLKLGCGRVSN